MRKRYIILVMLCIALVLQACTASPDTAVNETEESAASVDNNSSGSINDAINVNTSDGILGKSQWNGITLQVRNADKERSDETATQLADYLKLEMTAAEQSGGGAGYQYTYSDGSQYSDGDYIGYRTFDSDIRNYGMYISEIGEKPYYNLLNQELDGFSLEEAKEAAKEVFSIFTDVSIAEEPVSVYAIHAEYAAAVQEASDSAVLKYYLPSGSKGKYGTEEQYEKYAEKITWEKDDEVYYMVYDLMLEDIPFSGETVRAGSLYSVPQQAVIIIGKEGIRKIGIQGLYGSIPKNLMNEQNCTETEACDIVSKSYPYRKEQSKRTRLVYVPFIQGEAAKKEVCVYPYWEITVGSGQTDVGNQEGVYFVNAVDKQIYAAKN